MNNQQLAAARGGGPGRPSVGGDTSGQALDVTQARLLDSSAMEDGKGALALRGRDSQIDRDLALIERNLREEGLNAGQDGQDRGPAGTSARGAKKKAKKKRRARPGAKSALQGDGTAGAGSLDRSGADGPPAQSRTALGAYGADG